jgi:hypothetical protein
MVLVNKEINMDYNNGLFMPSGLSPEEEEKRRLAEQFGGVTNNYADLYPPQPSPDVMSITPAQPFQQEPPPQDIPTQPPTSLNQTISSMAQQGRAISEQGGVPLFTNIASNQGQPNAVYGDIPSAPPPTPEEMKVDKYRTFRQGMEKVLPTEMPPQTREGIIQAGWMKTQEMEKQQQKTTDNKRFQQGGVTDKGLSVGYDPSDNQWKVNMNGQSVPWNEQEHGKIKEGRTNSNLPQRSFSEWDKASKEQEFKEYILTGKNKNFSARDAKSTNQFKEELKNWQVETGLDAQKAGKIRSQYTGLDKSLQKMTGQGNRMQAFVDNIGLQIEEVKKLYNEVDRTGVRLVDLPKRELAIRAKGSGKEAAIASYLMEVSREIGKLSTNSTDSIAELSVEAQKKWDKIHDPNLSISELMPVLDATNSQANMRMSTWNSQIGTIEKRMGSLIDDELNKTKEPVKTERDVTSGIDYLKKSTNRNDAITRIRELSKKGWTREELANIVKTAGWE